MAQADGFEHVNNPDEFAEGKKAFEDGINLEDNPYDWGTPKNEAWHQGWQEGLSQEFK